MSNKNDWSHKIVSDLADHHDINVLKMKDFGSKAKNMNGPESDTDAMFIFDQPAITYKTINTGQSQLVDSIDTEIDGIDLHGWNIRKFGDLLADSNPQAIEFLQSDITYYALNDNVSRAFTELGEYALRNFNPVRLYMHYRSLAESNYNKYILNENDRSIKRNLKIIRAVLIARHIRRTHQIPDMDFDHFLENGVEREMRLRVQDFLEQKRDGNGGMEAGNPFQTTIEYEITKDVDEDDLNRKGIDGEKINEFIKEIDGFLYY